ncbi:patched domain-containing protein 3 [Fopius arisanus]|uniref:Patched domain-containing protein 3 n=1 Tax=Fopius arisanus TaxID=64838 RepID=A0A9R1T917_9HYME|nr:PREDICTED: patched domain-containing protein 3-like [Fopius arisanus]XP_011304846.1 PREDICTED: patched domain-containing protein 3-like [Fopius arisanus]XP_011304847.1 PREDICTED: patched domain-containing protein 3-like [Fopius arisanus]
MDEGFEENVGQRKSLCRRIRNVPESVAAGVQHFFYRLGMNIARSPMQWIAGSTIIVLLCLSGLYRFRQEKNPLKLWVPPDSDFVRDTEWLLGNFDEGQRTETMILTADNVLDPFVLYELNEITKRIISLQTSKKPVLAWTDVCFKVPLITEYTIRNRRGVDDDFFDEEPTARMNKTKFEPSVHAPSDIYCKIFNSFPKGCLLFSILDLWNFDSDLIRIQTRRDIIDKLHSTKLSPTLGHPMNFSELLGGVETDYKGRIVSAKAVKTLWMVHINFTSINMGESGNVVGTADWASTSVLDWEAEFVKELWANAERLKNENPFNKTIKLFYEAGRSFGDVSSSTMFQDITKLMIGIILMTLYVQFILSRFNWVEYRFCLTTAGLLCVGGAFIVAVGACSLFKVPFGPVHSSLPLMLLGLGVDDIFVMMASWKELMSVQEHREKSLEQRIAMMLSHAGAAICITSLTDVVAFIIGASTILPSLESFCIYAAVGVLVTFLLQITFFVAFFSLDVKRAESKRNGMFPCIIHKSYEPSIKNRESRISRIINYIYSKIVLTLPGKLLVIGITLGITTAGVMGTLQLQQWFDMNWFLPEGSYLQEFISVRNAQFPNKGYPSMVILGDLDYHTELPKILDFTDTLKNLSTIDHVDSWPHDFSDFVRMYYEKDVKSQTFTSEEFQLYLSKFLFSQMGGKYQGNFHFISNITCGQSAPRVKVSSINFAFKSFSGPDEWLPAMDNAKLTLTDANIDGLAFIWSTVFGAWVTDKVIATEVTRNIFLALICVMATTSVLIAEPQTCCWILVCVSLTLVDICGFMYYWGLSIDIVSCIGLELAVGLSVDYAAHVAHAFLHSKSPKNEENRQKRAVNAVRHIGVAVICGAGSMLLSQLPLIFSEAYVFKTFFKIFFLAITFGLWHGLLFLPVILSTIGPKSLHTHHLNVTETGLNTITKDIDAQLPLNPVKNNDE